MNNKNKVCDELPSVSLVQSFITSELVESNPDIYFSNARNKVSDLHVSLSRGIFCHDENN